MRPEVLILVVFALVIGWLATGWLVYQLARAYGAITLAERVITRLRTQLRLLGQEPVT